MKTRESLTNIVMNTLLMYQFNILMYIVRIINLKKKTFSGRTNYGIKFFYDPTEYPTKHHL